MKKKFNYHVKFMYNKGACRGSSFKFFADRPVKLNPTISDGESIIPIQWLRYNCMQ